METAAPTIRALELENQRLRAAQRESAEAILELQREACARDGVPMPSERPLVDKLRDENQRLRADVAELVEALRRSYRQLGSAADRINTLPRVTDTLLEVNLRQERARIETILSKHGA